MKFVRLTNEESAATGWTHKWIIDYEDLVEAGATTSTVLTLATAIPANSKCEATNFRLPTPFDGGATSELTMKLGYDLASGTDDDDAFLAATSVHADATYKITRANPTALSAETVDETYSTQESAVLNTLKTTVNELLQLVSRTFDVAWDLEAVFTATGANLNALTTGEVHVFARITRQTLF